MTKGFEDTFHNDETNRDIGNIDENHKITVTQLGRITTMAK